MHVTQEEKLGGPHSPKSDHAFGIDPTEIIGESAKLH